MIIGFETKSSKVLEDFLERYENPKSLTAQLSKNSFVDFSIHRFKDLIVISQKHLYDVVAKWLLLLAITDLTIAYIYSNTILFYIGGIFTFIGILWLSPQFRFYALKFALWKRGHREKVEYVNPTIIVEKLLLKYED